MEPLTVSLLGLLIFLTIIYIGGIIKASRMEDIKERELYIKELDAMIANKEKIVEQLQKKSITNGYEGGDFTKWRRRSL